MLNPITEKLGKLFNKNKNKRNKLHTEAETPLRLFSRSFMRGTDKENDPLCCNRLKESALTPWKSISVCRSDVRSEVKGIEYQRVLRDNEKLKDMVKTHQLMEEFYLKELQLRRKEKSNLEWRLSVLNEQIQNSSKPKRKVKQSQILRERVQAARKGLEASSSNLQ